MLTPRIPALALLLAAMLVTIACDDEDEIGTPCESEDDCSEALICDVHDGKGTCQLEHGHRVVSPDPELTGPDLSVRQGRG